MDCRKFHKDLDDYLDDGLDFAGRFGMERHAQQCIGCGKVLSDSQRLRLMAHRLERVKAPADFESRVLAEIGKEKNIGGLAALRRFWLYGFEFPSARKLALASSFLAVLAAGIFYMYPLFFGTARPVVTNPGASAIAAKVPAEVKQVKLAPVPDLPMTMPVSHPVVAQSAKVSRAVKEVAPPDPDMEQMVDREVGESDYVEFRMVGPDNRPVTVRWPNKSRLRYGQTPEEYFIRNVSH